MRCSGFISGVFLLYCVVCMYITLDSRVPKWAKNKRRKNIYIIHIHVHEHSVILLLMLQLLHGANVS